MPSKAPIFCRDPGFLFGTAPVSRRRKKLSRTIIFRENHCARSTIRDIAAPFSSENWRPFRGTPRGTNVALGRRRKRRRRKVGDHSTEHKTVERLRLWNIALAFVRWNGGKKKENETRREKERERERGERETRISSCLRDRRSSEVVESPRGTFHRSLQQRLLVGGGATGRRAANTCCFAIVPTDQPRHEGKGSLFRCFARPRSSDDRAEISFFSSPRPPRDRRCLFTRHAPNYPRSTIESTDLPTPINFSSLSLSLSIFPEIILSSRHTIWIVVIPIEERKWNWRMERRIEFSIGPFR